VRAQTPSAHADKTATPLEFEVATIKPVDPNAMNQTGTEISSDGKVNLYGLSLKAMIAEAFDVSYWQIQGGDAWVEKTRYNVVGVPPEKVRDSKPSTRHGLFNIDDPHLREMLQNLLIQRFQLKVHRATETGKVYFLERSSKKLALITRKPLPADSSDSGGSYGSIGRTDQWVLYDTTMPELARFASSYVLHRPVLDRTGLTGAFDYRSAPDAPDAPPVDHSSSFLQLLNEVGLKLEPGKGESETLVIDHAELPSEN
jgi:uncharacterized protein (TIGR03435 family)